MKVNFGSTMLVIIGLMFIIFPYIFLDDSIKGLVAFFGGLVMVVTGSLFLLKEKQ